MIISVLVSIAYGNGYYGILKLTVTFDLQINASIRNGKHSSSLTSIPVHHNENFP